MLMHRRPLLKSFGERESALTEACPLESNPIVVRRLFNMNALVRARICVVVCTYVLAGGEEERHALLKQLVINKAF